MGSADDTVRVVDSLFRHILLEGTGNSLGRRNCVVLCIPPGGTSPIPRPIVASASNAVETGELVCTAARIFSRGSDLDQGFPLLHPGGRPAVSRVYRILAKYSALRMGYSFRLYSVCG